MNSKFNRRLEQLENRVLPQGGPESIEVVFIGPDQTVQSSFVVEIDSRRPVPLARRGRWPVPRPRNANRV